MSKVGRNSWVTKEPSFIAVPDHYKEQIAINSRIRERNKTLDRKFAEAKKEWSFHPPEPMTLLTTRDCGEVPAGTVISVCQRVGVLLLARRAAHIYGADDVTPDVVLAGTHEQLARMLGI